MVATPAWQAWQDSRDRQQELYLPDREEESRRAVSTLDWDAWWRHAAQDEALAGPVAERFARFGGHADGDPRPVRWHLDVLRQAGFDEARALWHSGPDVVVLALAAHERPVNG